MGRVVHVIWLRGLHRGARVYTTYHLSRETLSPSCIALPLWLRPAGCSGSVGPFGRLQWPRVYSLSLSPLLHENNIKVFKITTIIREKGGEKASLKALIRPYLGLKTRDPDVWVQESGSEPV